ncbi:GNAT family N-acetyltransferase [Microbacterium sp. ASV49]|uniref:GNAT family N-acetyltransferase n=1 Tax=Microbacterium candidum TaxID=3041922 RepID=A0ABT7MY67_9MICO|nr:GNAT family N-acetyltransferase [Microbacterium sp. ASV49]MDL9979388.1 GNAT family N-acetyltransferase [Microbacterium sp. ASV49]
MIASLELPASIAPDLLLRNAEPGDLDAIIELLSDDPISRARGDRASGEDRADYARGLDEITRDPNNTVILAIGKNAGGEEEEIRGMLQLTVIPGLARRGSRRLLIEAVRVRTAQRSQGTGTAMMRWVIDTAAPATNSRLIQLTSDSQRADAHRFYARLGFTDSHIGFKLTV